VGWLRAPARRADEHGLLETSGGVLIATGSLRESDRGSEFQTWPAQVLVDKTSDPLVGPLKKGEGEPDRIAVRNR